MDKLDFLNVTEENRRRSQECLDRVLRDQDILFTELAPDRAVGVLKVREDKLNLYGMVYGGDVFNLMDVVAGIANLCGGGYGPTVSGNIEYISSTRGQKELVCRGVARKVGRTFSHIDTEVLGEDGKLLAKGSFVYFNH